MAKWKSQNMYAVTLTDIYYSSVTLSDAILNIPANWYWGGFARVTYSNRRMSGDIESPVEDVLPLIRKRADGVWLAILPLNIVSLFEGETKVQWRDGLTFSEISEAVNRTYFRR